MHLKSLRLENFKSHKDTTIEFGQITSIVGSNNAGKTNILRALKLVLHHTDWPASWIRYKQDKACITVEFTNGLIIRRHRTPKSQSVEIVQPDGTITKFEGKKEATSFIQEATGIKKIVLDEVSGPEDLNFSDVNEGPYLLGGRSDSIQRKVAGILGANSIEDARNRLTKKARKVQSSLDESQKELDSLKPTLDVLRSHSTKANDLFNSLNSTYNKWSELTNKLEKINNEIEHRNSLLKKLNVNVVTKAQKDLATCKDLLTKFEGAKAQEELANMANQPALDVETIAQLKKKVLTLFNKLNDYSTLVSNLEIATSLSSKLKERLKELNTNTKELEDCIVEKKDFLLQNNIEICPLCKSPFNKDSIHEHP